MGSVKSLTRTIFLILTNRLQSATPRWQGQENTAVEPWVFKPVHRWPQMSGSEQATIGFARFMRLVRMLLSLRVSNCKVVETQCRLRRATYRARRCWVSPQPHARSSMLGHFPAPQRRSLRQVKGFEESLINLVRFHLQTRITFMYARSCI
jgi:hypothetical protein